MAGSIGLQRYRPMGPRSQAMLNKLNLSVWVPLRLETCVADAYEW